MIEHNVIRLKKCWIKMILVNHVNITICEGVIGYEYMTLFTVHYIIIYTYNIIGYFILDDIKYLWPLLCWKQLNMYFDLRATKWNVCDIVMIVNYF